MKRAIFILLALLLLPILVGCPGNRQIDRDANEQLLLWVMDQDANGWDIVGSPDTNYQNIVIVTEFKPTKFSIAIDSDSVNPYHQRNMLGQIAQRWRGCYPANMTPRFNLRVVMYDTEINKDFELGWTEIDEDGNIDTHHARTQDVM